MTKDLMSLLNCEGGNSKDSNIESHDYRSGNSIKYKQQKK